MSLLLLQRVFFFLRIRYSFTIMLIRAHTTSCDSVANFGWELCHHFLLPLLAGGDVVVLSSTSPLLILLLWIFDIHEYWSWKTFSWIYTSIFFSMIFSAFSRNGCWVFLCSFFIVFTTSPRRCHSLIPLSPASSVFFSVVSASYLTQIDDVHCWPKVMSPWNMIHRRHEHFRWWVV